MHSTQTRENFNDELDRLYWDDRRESVIECIRREKFFSLFWLVMASLFLVASIHGCK